MDSSSRTKSKEMRPTNPVVCKMFSSIQLDTEPQMIMIKFGFSEKCKSQAVLSFPRKSGSFDPIHEISSKTMTIFLSLDKCPRKVKCSTQSEACIFGGPKLLDSWAEKSSNCLCLLIPGTGGSPEKIQLVLLKTNSLINRLFPTRLLPLITTRLADFFFSKSSRDSSSFVRPMNFMSFLCSKISALFYYI